MVSKAAAKKAEAEVFTALVKAVLEKAHAAAHEAAAEFARTAQRDPQGFIADASGIGYIVVYNLSYRLRSALKSLGEIKPPPYRGGWALSGYRSKDMPEGAAHSFQTIHKACQAACDVLRSDLGGDGDFYAKTNID